MLGTVIGALILLAIAAIPARKVIADWTSTSNSGITPRNIADWDFRHIDRRTGPGIEADTFLSENFITVVAVDTQRVQFIAALLDNGSAVLDDDREHVQLVTQRPDAVLARMKGACSPFTRAGRFERLVLESMRREYRKYGRLRFRLLPPRQGAPA